MHMSKKKTSLTNVRRFCYALLVEGKAVAYELFTPNNSSGTVFLFFIKKNRLLVQELSTGKSRDIKAKLKNFCSKRRRIHLHTRIRLRLPLHILS